MYALVHPQLTQVINMAESFSSICCMDQQLVRCERCVGTLLTCILLLQEVNKVRKALYLKVLTWVGAVRKVLERMGYWADGVCPITGHCMYGAYELSPALVLACP